MPMYIKGMEVSTNKGVERVQDGEVFFKDGSWCDVVTGEIRNLGEGYINIVPIPKETTV